MNDSTSTPIRQKRKGARIESDRQAAVTTTAKRVNSVMETIGTRPESRSPDLVISAVRHRLVEVEELIERAIKVSAGPGDHTGRLLQIGWDQLLPKFFSSLQPDAFSIDTVNAAIDVLHDLQSVFVGVEAAERGAERGPIAQQAFNTVQNALSMLDQPELWPAIPTPSAEWNFEKGVNFARGCDLALDLLRAEEASRGQDVCCWRRHREGRPQFRFWKPYLDQLVVEPELVDGFDAVMSASKEDGMCVTANELARAEINEYAAGEVGADGTLPSDALIRVRNQDAQSGTRDPLHGHTPAQAGIVFGFIATRANAARQYCSGSTDSEFDQDLAADMFEQIGIAADQMIGGEIVGTPADWMIGHNFHQAGKAVQA